MLAERGFSSVPKAFVLAPQPGQPCAGAPPLLQHILQPLCCVPFPFTAPHGAGWRVTCQLCVPGGSQGCALAVLSATHERCCFAGVLLPLPAASTHFGCPASPPGHGTFRFGISPAFPCSAPALMALALPSA